MILAMRRRLDGHRQTLRHVGAQRIALAVHQRLDGHRQAVRHMEVQLRVLNPRAVLARGDSLTRRKAVSLVSFPISGGGNPRSRYWKQIGRWYSGFYGGPSERTGRW